MTMIYVAIINVILSCILPIILIRMQLSKLDGAFGVFVLSLMLLIYSFILFGCRKKIKRKRFWSLVSLLVAVTIITISFVHLVQNPFVTKTNIKNYPSIIKLAKTSNFNEVIEHFPDELPDGKASFFMQRTFDLSKLQLTLILTNKECEQLYEQYKSKAIYHQRGFDLSKSKGLSSTKFRNFANTKFINLSKDYKVFVLYVSEDNESSLDNWQNIYSNSGIVINNEENMVIYWAVYP